MFYNSQRITKSGLKELSESNKISEEQNIINNRQKLKEISQKEKMKDLLVVKYMRKCGIKRPQLYLEDEINQFIKKDKLKQIDIQKINDKMKQILNKQRPKKKRIIKSPTTIFIENKLPEIAPSSAKKKEKILLHPIHSSLSTGNLKATISQPHFTESLKKDENKNIIENQKIIPDESNVVCSNTISKRKKKLYINPEEELAELEKEFNLEEKKKNSRKGYERLFKFFSEGNEWEAMDRYNRELYEQEIEEEKRLKFVKKKKLKEDLEKQIKEKLKRDYVESLEEEKYKQLFNKHNKQMEKLEEEEKVLQHKRLLLEKRAQEEQIKEKRIRDRLEMLREKRFDKNSIEAVKKELEKEKKFLEDKKIKEYEIIKRDMKETENHIKNKLQKLKLEKEEDKIFCQDLEKSEIKKEQERKKTLARMKSVGAYRLNEDNIKKIIGRIKKEEEEEDEKLKIYLLNKKRIEDAKEEEEKNRRLQMRYDLKKYLEIQMEEKRKEKEFQKSLWKEQGKIWNIDSDKYALEKKEIEEKIKIMNLKNAEKLREQIQSKKEEFIKKKSMSIMEYTLNKNTLNKIMDSMDNENKKL